MRKNAKFLLMLFVFSVFVLGLISCKKPDNTGNGENPSAFDNEVIYSPYVNATIVLGEGIEAEDVSAIRNAYYKILGKEISIKTSDENHSEHEIIVGKTDREISNKAYRSLVLYHNDDEMVGYSIYSDGKSVAIAFDEASFGENVAYNEAMDYFISKYMKNATLKLDTGVVNIDSFDPIERQEERDEATLNRLWDLKSSQIMSKLEKLYDKDTLHSGIVEELQNLFQLYNPDYKTVTWLANLYDPVTGGFYYSNSARNNEGFAPDLGSTAEALYLTELILGGYGGTLTDYFGEEIAGKFVSFAKNMQDSNGYFYHPHWNRELTDKNLERKEIDVLNALNILNAFAAKPTYDTLNVKGEGVVAPVSKLTVPLRISKATAVSALASSDDGVIYIPSYLKSEETFSSYLSTLDIQNDVAGVCNTINSELPLYIYVDKQLEERGESYRLCEMLENYLGDNTGYSGLWSSARNPSYDDIGAVVEVIKIYNALGAAIPYYERTLQAVLDAMTFETNLESINDIAAVWTALDYIVNNIKLYSDEIFKDRVDSEILSIYISYDKLLAATREKLSLLLNDDGSYSSELDLTDPEKPKAYSSSQSYGMSVALPLTEEGDINATLTATKSIWMSVFSVLGIGDVPIFNTSDRMMFQKTLLDMGVIIKNEIIETPPEDFETYGPDNEYSIKETLTSSDSYSRLEVSSEEHGNVLHLYSSVDAGTDQFYFKPQTKVNSASCYSYEMDICVLPDQTDGFTADIFLYRYMHLISLEKKGDEIRIIERSTPWSNPSYDTDLGVRAKVGEWFNIRVEYYVGTRDTVRTKIFFKGESDKERRCIAVTDNFSGKQTASSNPSMTFEGIAVMSAQKKVMSLQVDNVLCESSYKTYMPVTSSSLNINVDTPDKKQQVHNFDSYTVGSTPSELKPSGEASAVTVKSDSSGNNVVAITEKAGEVILPLDQRGSATNSAVIAFDFTVDGSSAVGSKYQINFNEYLNKERNFGAIQILVVEEDGKKYVTIAEVTTAGSTGTVYSNVELSFDIKYSIRLQIFYEERAIVTSIGDEMGYEIVGVSSNVLNNAHMYYMFETTIKALTPNKTSTILIDNLVSERIVDDYEQVINPEIPRVEYTFDDTEGMELKGVELSDGMLSFDNVPGNEAYIKIPVNKRVTAPTVSVVEFDVIATEKTHGEIIVRLTDEDGKIVASLALVRRENKVEIYEYTSNGRYPTPLCTVENPTFKLKIKYSEAKQGYNLFVDDVYVASSSLIYTETSGTYKFETLYIGASTSSGFAIDNLYAEKISDFLIVDTGTNSENSSEVLTFESSSFASMPNKLKTTFGSSGAALNIREQKIGDVVNKVLEFYSGGSGNILQMTRTQTVAGTDAAFFETEMMIKSHGGATTVTFSPQTYIAATGRYPYVLDFKLSVSGVDKPVKLTTKDIDVTLGEDITEGKWFKIRFEYAATPYDYDYDGVNDAIVRVYVNGNAKPVAEGHTVTDKNIVPAASTILSTKIATGSAGQIFFNDMSQGQFNMEYEPPIEADTHTLTFSPGVVTYQTAFTFGKNTSVASVITDTEDAVNKVLQFYTSADSADKMSVIVTQTAKPEDNANAVMFETDIKIEPVTDTATFYLEPVNAKGKQPFRLTLTATKDGDVTLTDPQNSAKKIVLGSCGEWIHLKVEYMNPMEDYTGDRKADILYKVYVGEGEEEVLKAKGYNPYTAGAYYDPLTLTKYVFTTQSADEATIIFDNIRFWQVPLTPDTPDVTDDKEDFNYGGSGFDPGAWN